MKLGKGKKAMPFMGKPPVTPMKGMPPLAKPTMPAMRRSGTGKRGK